MKYNSPICHEIQKKVELAKLEAIQYLITWSGGSRFKVDHYDHTYVIDLDRRTRGCKKFGLIGIQCCHAIAAIMFSRKEIKHYVDY